MVLAKKQLLVTVVFIYAYLVLNNYFHELIYKLDLIKFINELFIT